MAACSSRQMGLAAPPGTSRTLQWRLCSGRCCWERTLFSHVLSQCISLAACTGRTIIVTKELFITVLPQQDSWGRMLVWALLFPVHTQLHTPQWCLYPTHVERSSDITLGFIFPRGHLFRGKKECSSNHSQSTPHAKAWRTPHKLPQLLHELIRTNSMVKPLTIQTNPNANVASLTLACFRLTSAQKTALMLLLRPIYEWGEGNLFLKNSGLKLVTL